MVRPRRRRWRLPAFIIVAGVPMAIGLSHDMSDGLSLRSASADGKTVQLSLPSVKEARPVPLASAETEARLAANTQSILDKSTALHEAPGSRPSAIAAKASQSSVQSDAQSSNEVAALTRDSQPDAPVEIPATVKPVTASAPMIQSVHTSRADRGLSVHAFARETTARAANESTSVRTPPALAIVTKKSPERQASPDNAPTSPAGHLEGRSNTAAPSTQLELPQAHIASSKASAAEAALVVKIARGDSLSLIFKRHGLRPADLANMMRSNEAARSFKRLRPGQTLEITKQDDGKLAKLVHHVDVTRAMHVEHDDGKFEFEEIVTPLQTHVATASGVVESSLYLAGKRAGLTSGLIMRMVEIFGWDIDFALDIRAGDRFTVVYQELHKDGRKVRDGHILAAEFVNRGRDVRAVRYEDPSGKVAYYSDDGHSMRKAFLRTPVKFARISSRFNLSRRHPVLHRIRAHKGVDYAASTGTPIKAAGDGKVIFAGRKGGYGRTVVLKHGSEYTTLYAHMRRIGKGIRAGVRVEQGQTIGTVGSSGLATGPHLHYEFRVRNVHKDPLKVKLPKALPIAKEYKQDFKASTRQVLAQLEHASKSSVASAR